MFQLTAYHLTRHIFLLLDFITGADDSLAKVFYLGAGVRNRDRCLEGGPPSFNYLSNTRGAVLVCTLRGHAKEISDIDVSLDNSLLATASVDGDVRVWRLLDGSQVAVLRAHKGGSMMVSWSTLYSFHLTTCGNDGLAKMWDVEKAARDHRSSGGIESLFQNWNNSNENNDSYVDFVFNDRIENDVSLLAQMHHEPELPEESISYSGLVRQHDAKPVTVQCLTRCPVGGHFATGADNGCGFIWAEDNNITLRPRRLALLPGHKNAITDIKVRK